MAVDRSGNYYGKKNNLKIMTKESNFEKENYIKLLYSSDKRPITDYPIKLATYIRNNYYLTQGKFLDIGCGRGDMLKAFHDIGYDAYGTDISPASKELVYPIPFTVCDLSKNQLDYPDNSFDFVFSKSVIEHLREPEKLLNEAYRILKPGGKFVVMTPSWMHTYAGAFYLDHTHVSPFILNSLRDAMLLANFKNVDSLHFYQLPFLWKLKFLKPLIYIFSKLPIPYAPLYDSRLPQPLNRLVRFSKELMLISCGEK